MWCIATNQQLKQTNFVCELHFNANDVFKYDRTTLKDGSIFEYKYVTNKLKKNAVPQMIYNVEENEDFTGAQLYIHINETDETENKSTTINTDNITDFVNTSISDEAENKIKNTYVNITGDHEINKMIPDHTEYTRTINTDNTTDPLNTTISYVKTTENKVINSNTSNYANIAGDHEINKMIADHTEYKSTTINTDNTTDPLNTSISDETENEVINSNTSNNANIAGDREINKTIPGHLIENNESLQFSLDALKTFLETQPHRQNWSWKYIEYSHITFSYISSKLELECHVHIDTNLTVKIKNAKINILIHKDVIISSIDSVWQLLNSLENSTFCDGTGLADPKCAPNCRGILSFNEQYKKKMPEYRCVICLNLRYLILKRNKNAIDYEARWKNANHRLILESRKLKRAIQKNEKMKIKLSDLKDQCAETRLSRLQSKRRRMEGNSCILTNTPIMNETERENMERESKNLGKEIKKKMPQKIPLQNNLKCET